jgi:hypothetical protein
MADGKAHKYVAITAAAGVTAYITKEQTGLDFWLQLAGSALGVLCTGNLPDTFEPPVSSYHWGTFHSVGMGGTIVSQLSRLSDIRKFCQEQADECKETQRPRAPTTKGPCSGRE